MPILMTVCSMIATYFTALLAVVRAIRDGARGLSARFDRIAPSVVLHGPAASLDDACGTLSVVAPDTGVWSVAPVWQTPIKHFDVESVLRFDLHPEVVESILPAPTSKPAVRPAKRSAAHQPPEEVTYDRSIRCAELATMNMSELRAIAGPHGIKGNSLTVLRERILAAGI